MSMSTNRQSKYQLRNASLFDSVNKIKLWPSRSGLLHGIRDVKGSGDWLELSTHCGVVFKIRDSKNGRGIRQLKHRNYKKVCKKCGVPSWKIEKYRK